MVFHRFKAIREVAIVSLVAFVIRRLDVVECEVTAFLITQFGHSLEKIGIGRRLPGLNADKPETQHLRLLRACRERPRRRAADPRDKLAAIHSITSSRRPSSVGLFHSITGLDSSALGCLVLVI